MNDGYEKLYHQASNALRDTITSLRSHGPGDSEIERLFSTALYIYASVTLSEYKAVFRADTDEKVEYAKSLKEHFNYLIIRPQVNIEPAGRVDFVIYAYDHVREQWRQLVVECDGHPFHSTKEQLAKDKSRDRKARLADYDVFRFTGSELWQDPWKCVEEVYAWALKGLRPATESS